MKPTKKCSRCSDKKAITDFHKSPNSPSGRFTYCKTCHQDATRKFQNDNKDNIKYRHQTLKHNAKRRGIEVRISELQHAKILGDRICFYCDEDFSGDGGSGINRCDSTKGYIPGNIKSCCKICNGLMSNFTVEQLRSRLIKIYKRITKPEEEKK